MRQRFIENDLNMKMVEVVADPAYRATELGDGETATEDGHHRHAGQSNRGFDGLCFPVGFGADSGNRCGWLADAGRWNRRTKCDPSRNRAHDHPGFGQNGMPRQQPATL